MAEQTEGEMQIETFIDKSEIYPEFNPQLYLEKLLQFDSLGDSEKKHYVNFISTTIRQTHLEHLEKIINLLLQEDYDVQENFCIQFDSIFEIIMASEQKQDYIKKCLLPLIEHIMQDDNLEFKESAIHIIQQVACQLPRQDLENIVLTNILRIAHDDENDLNRIIAVKLLSNLSEQFGQDLCEQFIGFEFLSLGDDLNPKIRRETVLNLNKISKIVSEKFFQTKMLQFYEHICTDQDWIVRKAAIEVLIDIIQLWYLINSATMTKRQTQFNHCISNY